VLHRFIKGGGGVRKTYLRTFGKLSYPLKSKVFFGLWQLSHNKLQSAAALKSKYYDELGADEILDGGKRK